MLPSSPKNAIRTDDVFCATKTISRISTTTPAQTPSQTALVRVRDARAGSSDASGASYEDGWKADGCETGGGSWGAAVMTAECPFHLVANRRRANPDG